MSNRIDLGNLELQLIEKINQSPSEYDVGALSVALTELRNARINNVASLDDLPAFSENIGKIYYVEDQNAFYIGFDKFWAPSFTAPSALNLFTWGLGGLYLFGRGGQLGNGCLTCDRSSPTTTAGLGTNWCQVDMGSEHSTAIKSDGTLWTWGCNWCGPLGIGDFSDRSFPFTPVGGGTNWSQVSGGLCVTAAVKTDGTLWTWGFDNVGQLGVGSTATCRLSPVTTAGGGTNWCQVGIGNCSGAAIKTDGTLWTWGGGNTGQLGSGSTAARSSPGTTAGGGTTWCQVDVGQDHMAAIKTDGTLWTWGYNGIGQLGDGTTISRTSPVTTAGGGTNWCQVSATLGRHMAAVKTDGTLWTWGFNCLGQLGTGNTTDRSSPGTVAGGGTNWCQVGIGNCSGAAIKTDGTLWTWGFNANGRLGTNNTTCRCSPGTTVGNISTWFQVSMGCGHTGGIWISPPSF